MDLFLVLVVSISSLSSVLSSSSIDSVTISTTHTVMYHYTRYSLDLLLL